MFFFGRFRVEINSETACCAVHRFRASYIAFFLALTIQFIAWHLVIDFKESHSVHRPCACIAKSVLFRGFRLEVLAVIVLDCREPADACAKDEAADNRAEPIDTR